MPRTELCSCANIPATIDAYHVARWKSKRGDVHAHICAMDPLVRIIMKMLVKIYNAILKSCNKILKSEVLKTSLLFKCQKSMLCKVFRKFINKFSLPVHT